MKDQEKSSENQVDATSQQFSDDRREFLKKCKELAIYTAPAVAALLLYDAKTAHANGST